ncbi:U4/U6.U5 tri-snRNP-associated protein 2 [Corchorus olitorius]|uniref:U4/U6.U5 tri-snRNP-associated protein 2 n=1 Tax=Corchorus olitorius TaxID=93759 RepID=A0A1R3JKN8_9ROSI|nr:U4/U6.U5 tri-snRNP-associated protein 2 [Corchorus olitorius]
MVIGVEGIDEKGRCVYAVPIIRYWESPSMHEGVRGHVFNNLIRMCNDLEFLMVHTSDYLLGMVGLNNFQKADFVNLYSLRELFPYP